MEWKWVKVRFLTQRSSLQKLDGFGGWHLVVKITVQIFLRKAAWIVERMVNTIRDISILKAGGFSSQNGAMFQTSSSLCRGGSAKTGLRPVSVITRINHSDWFSKPSVLVSRFCHSWHQIRAILWPCNYPLPNFVTAMFMVLIKLFIVVFFLFPLFNLYFLKICATAGRQPFHISCIFKYTK